MSTLNLARILFSNGNSVVKISACGMKHFPAPIKYPDIEMPEKPKLRFMDKVPVIPAGVRAPKMQKRLRYMRGPEEVHNFLLHKQFGIMALGGGRLRFGHFEMMRLTIGRKMDTSRMFALWRIDAPWQPITSRGQGQRLGGGKGAIDFYCTPVKAGRILLELGGKCEYLEVKEVLENVAKNLPFKAMAVSQEILDEMKRKEESDKKNNQNPYTMEYIIKNNMGGCQHWLSPAELKWFGKYP